jgi:hypothetical protein
MKICSFCGQENEEALAFCHDCGMDLASERTSDQVSEDLSKPLAVVATFGDSVEASIVQGRLEQAGIEACIPEELDPSPFGNFMPLARVTVRVAEKDLQEAKEILAAAA